jgi:hypothetical protein
MGEAGRSGIHHIVGFNYDAFGCRENLRTTRNNFAFCAFYIQLDDEWPRSRDRSEEIVEPLRWYSDTFRDVGSPRAIIRGLQFKSAIM